MFVIAEFVIARCHCNYMQQILECEKRYLNHHHKVLFLQLRELFTKYNNHESGARNCDSLATNETKDITLATKFSELVTSWRIAELLNFPGVSFRGASVLWDRGALHHRYAFHFSFLKNSLVQINSKVNLKQ